MKRVINRLRARRGETLVETLVATLVISLSIMLMVTMTTTAMTINRNARAEDVKLYGDPNNASEKGELSKAETYTGATIADSSLAIYGTKYITTATATDPIETPLPTCSPSVNFYETDGGLVSFKKQVTP